MLAETIDLNSKANIPVIGLGTWQIQGRECRDAVSNALSVGYRHIDTADIYQNHEAVGKGIKKSGIPRNDIFLTTKVWRDQLDTDGVNQSIEKFLKELDTHFIDLLLIHWPNNEAPIDETLDAMLELKHKGKVNAIGISNFTVEQMELFMEDYKDDIDNHQFEIHPSLYQKDVINYCFDHGISVTAYSPVAQGQDLSLDDVRDIAQKHNCTEAQVVLAWIRQRGMISIPRSQDVQHIEENFESLNIKLDNDELKELDNLDTRNRLVEPDFAPF